uniref:Rab GTPase-like protein n=1 Tax=Coptotermes formosanus TaxID=36987 RepID=L0AUK4_COPFO|nr:Rab GTPase-like protein [Coptotermes formosanus]
MDEAEFDYIFKIVIVGDSGVGRTNLLLQFVQGVFIPQSRSTIGVEFRVKTVEVNGKSVKIQIWDTAGQERYRAITKNYYRGAVVALLLYDITSSSSYNSLQKWIDELKMHADGNVIVMLIGNKCDLSGQRTVLEADAQNLANDNSFLFFETSAKEATNVKEAFMALVRELVNQNSRSRGDGESNHNQSVKTGAGVSIDEPTDGKKKKGCCKK